MEKSVISKKEAKKIVERYLTDQLQRVMEQTVLVDTGRSWCISFAGIPSEELSISKHGEIIFNDQGHSCGMTGS